ncbi:MAG: hypothetical protein R3Y57_02550 [Erysipelotrichaceae bacterium]
MKLVYSLNKNILKEYYEYLAMHDAKIQRKLITLILGISSIIVVISLLIFDLTYISLIVTLIAIILTFMFFPKIYWKQIFDKSSDKVNKLTIDYSSMIVELNNECILVNSNTTILYECIENIGFTKNTCLIFYKEKDVVNTLIIPIEKIKSLDKLMSIIGRENE